MLTSNIVDQNELKQTMSETLQFLSNVLSRTLGPYGSTTIIQDRFLNHTITKDGYTLLKKIYIEEEAPRTILDLVKRISRTLVRRVGDGSTSSIIIANSIFQSLNLVIDQYNVPPKDILDILDKIAAILEEKIRMVAKPISDDMSELVNIAAVSTNNDLEMGKLIKEIFTKVGRYGFINLEKSKNDTTWYDSTRGFEIQRGLINNKMINQPDGKTCELINPFIFMCDSVITETDLPIMADIIGKICLQMGQPLVLLAKGFDMAFETFIQMNLLKNKDLPLLCVDISTDSKRSKERFSDLVINLGCQPYLKSEQMELPSDFQEILKMLGQSKKVISTEYFTRFIEGLGDEQKIKERTEQLLEQIREKDANESYIEMDEDIYELRKRLALLQNSMATLYVGGATENAKETTKYLIEDAVFACKSAINNGYVIGGNLIIPIILNIADAYNEILSKVQYPVEGLVQHLLKALYDAFSASFKRVLLNRSNDDEEASKILGNCIANYSIFNLKTNTYEADDSLTVINSAETDIEIMKSALSIIGLLATSNQFIRMNLNIPQNAQ